MRDIAGQEHVSPSTVRRQVRKRTKLIAGICQQFMRQAARENEWREARFWQGLLRRLDAHDTQWPKPTGEVREWTECLTALRYQAMKRPDVPVVVNRPALEWKDGGDGEMKRHLGVEYPAAVIELLGQLRWAAAITFDLAVERHMATSPEAGLDALDAEAAQAGLWAAIWEPIMLRLFRRGLKDYLKNEAA